VDDSFGSETSRLAEYLGIESKPPVAGAACPFVLHEPKANFSRLNADPFCPAEYFCLKDLGRNNLFKRIR